MMRRVVSLLLIPLLLVSQGLCFEHSHRGTDQSEPVGHAAQPHIHLHGHRHHHHHGHSPQHGIKHPRTGDRKPERQQSNVPTVPHDDDAIYITTLMVLPVEQSLATVLSAKDWLATTLPWDVERVDLVTSPNGAAWSHPPPIGLACPLYVRTLTLRC